jgi:3-methyladenine DNA glycosylase/8-oxoguanine DNA glycosylase
MEPGLTGSSQTLPTMKLTLTARPPFSFRTAVMSHGWMQLVPFNFDENAGLLTYVDRLSSGRVVEYRMREAPGGLRLEANGTFSTGERMEAKRKAAWMLGLDMDFSEFYRLARKEPKLRRAEERAQGRVLRGPTLFEDVVKTILTTNTLWGATKRMTANLAAQFGEPLPEDPSRHAFPTPLRLAATSEAILRTETRLGYRAPYILELAGSIASGALDLEALTSGDLATPDLRKRLLAIKGVGNYAAANLLVILGRYDYLPVDSWALKVVSHEWFEGGPVQPAQVEAAFEKWGKWKGLAYFMWDWSYYTKG